MEIKLKRVYEKSAKADGKRILVDRLWPRGLSRDDANIDMWLKEIAPSEGLRKWFHHDAEKWKEFKKRYLLELKTKKEAIQVLKNELEAGPVTLVYGAKDEEHNQALVLKEFLSL